MIDFCHISPTAYLSSFTITNGAHLVLAHLVEEDTEYRNYYANLNDGKFKIMDNSAFEMYKQGRPMYGTNDLLPMAKACNADMIVMSDYPNEPAQKTIDAAIETAPIYKDAGFKTFFVPQSKIGDIGDYLYGMEWALESNLVDRIGLSILGCPNAYGVEKDNKLQRYLSRLAILRELEKHDMLNQWAAKRFHCLGMVDGPNEIDLLREYHPYIASWDSSAAVWAGINNIRFDDTPTGLVNGKYEREVEFDFQTDLPVDTIDNVMYNVYYIDEMVSNEGVYK